MQIKRGHYQLLIQIQEMKIIKIIEAVSKILTLPLRKPKFGLIIEMVSNLLNGVQSVLMVFPVLK